MGCESPCLEGGSLKIVILADVHANLAALQALPEHEFDELWMIGDLVGFGPNPREVIQWAQENATAVVRGNHDHAAGFSVDPQCPAPYKALAEEILEYTQKICTEEEMDYLRSLPVYREITTGLTKFYLVHAVPTNPLFGYCADTPECWREQVDCIDADVLIVGHTHIPFLRREGKTTILNPGSLGQPGTGRPFACYAVWENGRILRKEYEYPIEDTVHAIRKMPISAEQQNSLIVALQRGKMPAQPITAQPLNAPESI